MNCLNKGNGADFKDEKTLNDLKQTITNQIKKRNRLQTPNTLELIFGIFCLKCCCTRNTTRSKEFLLYSKRHARAKKHADSDFDFLKII
jgi:hypothetical protein